VLLVSSRHNLTKLADEDLSLTIGHETLQPSDVGRDLGVWLTLSWAHSMGPSSVTRCRRRRRRCGHPCARGVRQYSGDTW